MTSWVLVNCSEMQCSYLQRALTSQKLLESLHEKINSVQHSWPFKSNDLWYPKGRLLLSFYWERLSRLIRSHSKCMVELESEVPNLLTYQHHCNCEYPFNRDWFLECTKFLQGTRHFSLRTQQSPAQTGSALREENHIINKPILPSKMMMGPVNDATGKVKVT